MYKLNVWSQFSSAHSLRGYDGPCQNLHGHNWKVRAGINCSKLDNAGMTIDYGIVKNHLESILQKFDHRFLNELDYFKECNPTSENIARVIFQEMKKLIYIKGCQVSEIEVWESDRTSMIYYE